MNKPLIINQGGQLNVIAKCLGVKRLNNSRNGNPQYQLTLLLPLSLRKNLYCYETVKTKANYGFVYAHNFDSFVEKNVEMTIKISPKGAKSITGIEGITDKACGINQ